MRKNGEKTQDARGAQRRGAGRPRGRVLSRQLILETGLRLIDERGEAGAGMRAIAQELGVRPSSLYNHVSGRDELIAGIRELISDRIDTSAFDAEPWHQALHDWAHAYRAAFAAHPPTITMFAVAPLEPGSRTALMYDRVCEALHGAGWPRERVLTIVVALESFILGSALDSSAADDMLDPGSRIDTPAFTAAYHERARLLAGTGERPADAAFQAGLAAMIAGLRAEFAALPRG
ncbi:TetR/AcrR family transcriptional regulator [Leucobacter sp. wl10]|uniref:TetR/AcrR family transcriptional regulator n=1 Tax=Leucobacter sp. wl10 TaxID=2304677 RepID=UPI000E5AE64E|nr:TetR/AcrR family transcriptional regulator [Leucobacter sp. wl10]RGE19832.1 TetR/AcrR family transcriptional regulator [Leucobacter sp. wl10]